MSIFDKFKKNNQIAENENTYMTILDSFPAKDAGIAVVCVINEGEININDFVQINGAIDTIAAIECNGQILKRATSGMKVGILLKNIQKNDAVAGEKIIKISL